MTDNKDLNQRFDQLEKRLDTLAVGNPLSTFQDPNSRSDEIDLRELFGILWQGKWWIIGITFLFAVAGVAYALSLPNMYQSISKLAPVEGESAGGLGGLSGIASMAGVSLGSDGGEKVQFAIELISSRTLVKELMEKHDLKPKVMAVLNWDRKSRVLTYDQELFDENTGRWLREVEAPLTAEPSFEEFYEVFRSELNVVVDKKTGFISVAFAHPSPYVAQELVEWIIELVNERVRQQDIEKTQASIDYLEDQLGQTALSEVKVALFELIEEQIKTKMLANVRKQYVLREIDPPYLPEKRYAPSRSIICILFVFLGGFLSASVVLIRGAIVWGRQDV